MSLSNSFEINDYIQQINVENLPKVSVLRPIFMPPKLCYAYNAVYDIPEILVDQVDHDKVKLSFKKNVKELNIPDSISRVSGTVISSRKHSSNEIGEYKKATMFHDITFSHWAERTDMKYEDYIPLRTKTRIGLQYRTPDLLLTNDKNLFIIEFSISKSSKQTQIDKDYSRKKNFIINSLEELYNSSSEEQLKEMSGKYDRIIILIVSVGPSHCVTNFEFESSVHYNELCFKMRVLMEAFPKVNYSGNAGAFQLHSFLEGLDPVIDPLKINFPINKTKDLFNHSLCDSIKQIKQNNKLDSRIMKLDLEIQNYRSKFDIENSNNYNLTRKNVVNFPFIVSSPSVDSYGLSFIEQLNEEDFEEETEPTACLFRSAIEWGKNNDLNTPLDQNNFYKNDLDMDVKDIEESVADMEFLGTKFSEQRSSYNRFKFSISERESQLLAEVGFNAKIRKGELKESREKKKKVFSLDTDVSDIESFLNQNTEDLFYPDFCLDSVDSEVVRLIETSLKVHKSKFSGVAILSLSGFLSTDYYRMMSLISDIATEVCISFRQNCKPNEIVIKKLLRHNVFLLIKPTRLSSQCFFSIFYKKDSCKEINYSGTFRKAFENDKWYWTQLLSMNEGKAENLCSAESRAIQMFYYYMDFYKLNLADSISAIQPDDLKKLSRMTLLSTLFLLSDKKENEEISSLSRFIAMEGFVSKPVYPQPWKIISKFPTLLRSRFSVFIINSLLKYCKNILINPSVLKLSEMTVDERSTLRGSFSMNHKWTNIVNPFFNSETLSNPGQLLNIMYVGYAVNKNQKVEDNASSKILKKIVDCEKEFQSLKQDFYTFSKEIRDKRRHIFDSGFLNHVINVVMKDYLPLKHGKFWKEMLSKRIDEEISNVDIEDVLLTLKASSSFDKDYENYNPDKKYTRKKVVEACNGLIGNLPEDTSKMIDLLPYCLESVEKRGAIETDIFSKMQHSGAREIYVLTLESRVLQWSIERISRIICDLFEGETMVHPKNKLRLPIVHNSECLKSFKGHRSVTYCVSADASKWSQTQHFSKFVLMLKKFLDPRWHNYIERVLLLWKNKKIMIPENLLKLFSRDTEEILTFSDDYMNEIYRSFRGIEKSRLMDEGSSYIRIESGMMQGILHYTSSLFHSVVNAYIEVETKKWFKSITKETLIVTLLQSSDDSSMLVSFKSTGDASKDELSTILTFATMRFKELVGQQLGLTTSIEKTTNFTPYLFEFNSNFFFGSAHYEPDYKASLATLVIPERESLVERQEQMYNSITNYISMGGSFFSALYHQFSQAFLHYKMLGSSTTFRFKVLSSALKIIKDPSLGLFLLDNPICCGLSSFSYTLWKMSGGSSYSRNIKECIELLKSGNVQKGESTVTLETTNHGLVTRTKVISFIKKEKHKKMLNSMNLPEDWLESMDSNPELLFRKSISKAEITIKICSKMHQPGVIESLSTGNTVARQIAFSSYALQSRILNDKSILTSKEESYTTMLECVIRECRKFSNSELEPLTTEELKYMFPYHDDYVLLSDVLSKKNYQVTRSVIDHRRTQTTVEVLEGDDGTRRPLLEVLKQRWFKDSRVMDYQTHSDEANEENFLDYKVLLPWIEDSVEETIRKSPFEHVYHLKNWLEQFKNDRRAIKISGASLFHRHGSTGLASVIRMNFLRGYRLMVTNINPIEIGEPQYEIGLDLQNAYLKKEKENALTALCLILSCFRRTDEEKATLIQDYFYSRSGKVDFPFSEKKIKSSTNSLSILQQAIIHGPSDLLNEKIRKSRDGCLGSYLIRQKYDLQKKKYYGSGVWRGNIGGVETELYVNSGDNDITICEKILIQRGYENLRQFEYGLKRWMKDNNVQARLSMINNDDTFRLGRVTITPTYYYSGTTLVSDSDRTPVFIVENMSNTMTHNRDIRIEVSRMTIRLVTAGDYSSKKTIFSFSPRSKQYREDLIIPEYGTTQILPTATKAWLSNRRLNFNECKSLVNNIIVYEGSESFVGEYRHFLRSKLILLTVFPLMSRDGAFLEKSFDSDESEISSEDIDMEKLLLDLQTQSDDGDDHFDLDDIYTEMEEMDFRFEEDYDMFQDVDIQDYTEMVESSSSGIDDIRSRHKLMDEYFSKMIGRLRNGVTDEAKLISARKLFREAKYNSLMKEYSDFASFIIQKDVSEEYDEITVETKEIVMF